MLLYWHVFAAEVVCSGAANAAVLSPPPDGQDDEGDQSNHVDEGLCAVGKSDALEVVDHSTYH